MPLFDDPSGAPARDVRADLDALRAACEQGARDLPQRLLAENAMLEWKPGTFGKAKQAFGNYLSACRSQASVDPKAVFGEAWPSPTGRPGSGGQPDLVPGAAASGPLKDFYEAVSRSGLPTEASAAMASTPSTAYDLASLSRTPPPDRDQAIEGFVEMLVDSGLIEHAAGEVAVDVAIDVCGALPWIGVAVCLSQGLCQQLVAISAMNSWRKTHALKPVLSAGAPQMGLSAVETLLQRRIGEYEARSVISLSAGAAEAAAAATDIFDFGASSATVGVAAGIAKTGADLAITAAVMAVNLYEFRQGNKLLRSADRDYGKLFSVCPLLGSYLLTEGEDAVLLGIMSQGRLTENWMDEVLALHSQLEKARRLANEVQRQAPFRLQGQWKGRLYLDLRTTRTLNRYADRFARSARDPQQLMGFLKDVRNRLRGAHPQDLLDLRQPRY